MKPLTCSSWFHLSLEHIEVICMVDKSTDHGRLLSICYIHVYIVCFYIRREDDRLQATGAELGDSIFNMTGENKVLHSYTIHFFTTSTLLSQPGVISNSPPKRVVFLMKFKFYRKASKCGLNSPTLLSTVLVNSLTFIIAVLQPNVRTKGQENQPA